MSSVAKSSAVPTGPELDNRRIAAAGIDLALPALVFALVAAAGYLTSGVALVLVGWTLYYFFAFESAHGQTLGKRAMKLRVTTPEGAAPSVRQVAMRTVVRVADGPLGLVAMIASGDRRQRLGDMAAGTVVADASAVQAEAPTEVLGPPAGVFHPRDLDAPTEQLPASEPVQAEPADAPKKTRKTLGGPELKLPKLRMPRMSKGPSLSMPELRVPKLRRKLKDPVAAQAAPAPPPVPAEPKKKKGRRSLGGPELKLPAFRKKDLSFGRGKKDPEPAPAPGFPEPAQDLTPIANRFDPFSEDAPEAAVEVTPSEPAYDTEIEPMPEPSFDHVPDVEVVRPEPEESPAVEITHHEAPEPEFDIPLPLTAQPASEARPEPAPAAAEPQPEQPAEDEETHVTVKPIETVSAIDLVMQDAQEGEGEEPEPRRPSL